MTTRSDANTEASERQHRCGQLQGRVNTSIRYHRMRSAFFSKLNTLISMGTFIAGSGVVVAALSQAEGTLVHGVFGALTVSAQAVALYVNPSQRAQSHSDLAREFQRLEEQMTRAGDLPSAKQVREFEACAVGIERQEPPTNWVTYAMAYNEYVSKIGRLSMLRRVTWWHRALGHVFYFRADKFLTKV